MRFALSAFLLILASLQHGCEDPQSKINAEKNKKENDRLQSYEAKTAYVYLYKQDTSGVFYHLRRDCPKLDEQLNSKLKGKAIQVTFKGGKIVDEKGFYYTGYSCDRCCP